jgi:hypothetical protein
MMSIYDFQCLGLAEKANIAWQGTFLGDRSEAGMTVQLYSLEAFYAEVFYDPLRNEIKRVRSFKSTRLLAPYLEDIKLQRRDLI